MKKEKNIIECPNCHEEIRSTDKFCNNCGEKLEPIVEQEEIVVETVPKRGRPKKIIDKDMEAAMKKKAVMAKDMVVNKTEQTKEEPVKETVDNSYSPKIESQTYTTETFNPYNQVNSSFYSQTNSNSYNSNNPYNQVNNIATPKKEKDNSFESKKKYVYPIIAVVVTFVVCLSAFGLFYNYYLKNLVIETTKREVTVTDTGISEAVEKVYDSVVVVESYVKDQLYATGTGFVYKTDKKDGYILTNSHVIENAEKINVVFTNNKREEVEVVGSDAYSDVALLAVDKDAVIAVSETGSSEDLKIGDTAFAVGAPLDSSVYAWTTTRGIISGKNRAVEVRAASSNGYSYSSYIMEVLQTDAAINNGNSGGPLCNSNGQVIGITNMKLASETIEGMGFAIPIETATKIADKFIAGEQIAYPYIGVIIRDAVPTYKDPNASGVYVESVEKNSPAAKGGLKAGDKILKVNDTEITSSSQFKFTLYKYEIGDTVEITVLRDGKEKVLKIELGSSGMNT